MTPEFVGLGLALGLGFLVGLEREWARYPLLGLRTFALIGIGGGLAALLARSWGGWIVAAGLLATAALIAARYLRHHHQSDDDDSPVVEHGATTVIAALAVYLVGAAAVAGYHAHAVVMGGAITLLLHWKDPLHDWVDRIGQEEFNAIIRFVLITLVVLPVLPNRTFGPYDVVNPFQAWLLVVLIVGLNLVGYLAFRLLRADSGAVVAGVLGGLVSSTATTVSFAGLTRRTPELAAGALLIILLASTVVYARVGIELALVAPALLREAIPPMAVFAAILLVTAGLIWPWVRRQRVAVPAQQNPARLKLALTFAALYVVFLLAITAAREHLGRDAVFAVAAVSGLADVDAVVLSTAQLFNRGNLEADTAWRAVFVASLANLATKIGIACVLGSPRLRVYMLAIGGAGLAVGAALLWLWP